MKADKISGESMVQRIFWSLYGCFVWDNREKTWLTLQIQQAANILDARKFGAGNWTFDAGCGTGEYAVALTKVEFQTRCKRWNEIRSSP